MAVGGLLHGFTVNLLVVYPAGVGAGDGSALCHGSLVPWAGVVLYGWLYERLASVLVLGLEAGLPCPPVGQQHLGLGVANIKQGSLLMQFLEWTPTGVVVLCTQILVVVLP